MSDDYAGFWLRVVAFIIDSIVLSVLHLLVIIPLYDSLLPSAAFDPDSTPPTVIQQLVAPDVSVLVLLVVGILYYALMEASRHQASIGKLALELKVTDAEGGRLSFSKSVLRNASKLLSAALLLVGYLVAAFTRRKQALHDLIAGAFVLKR
ncbi:MAG TPA: RDD family protein [Cyclobacteriaceae bacterium]|nr:RDD family protein [Cyclobacteriaceae bacterium]